MADPHIKSRRRTLGQGDHGICIKQVPDHSNAESGVGLTCWSGCGPPSAKQSSENLP